MKQLPSRRFPRTLFADILGPSLRFLLRDPFVGAGLEQVKRQGSAVEHLVVEGADVKLGAQFFLGAFAQFAES